MWIQLFVQKCDSSTETERRFILHFIETSGVAGVNLLGRPKKLETECEKQTLCSSIFRFPVEYLVSTKDLPDGQQIRCSPLSNMVWDHWVNGDECLFEIAPRKPWL